MSVGTEKLVYELDVLLMMMIMYVCVCLKRTVSEKDKGVRYLI